jgi:hypothetical protein
MGELKTKPTEVKVQNFLNTVENTRRKTDSLELLDLIKDITNEEPTMWGTSIIGFGSYHYKYKSGREGNWFKTGFSPRKRSLTIYLGLTLDIYNGLLSRLGKYRAGKGCIYINKLSDVNTDVLKEILKKSLEAPDVYIQ